jgi:DNA-binding transcriptional MerR regulator
MLTVGQMSKQLGINSQTLYFYERIGLIPAPQRTEAGYRLFNEKDIERLRFITRTKKLGLTLEEIKELLILQEDNNLSCQEVYQKLLKKVQQIDEQIEQLTTLKSELLPLVESARLKQENNSCVILSEWEKSP